jgi:hypothetical protein
VQVARALGTGTMLEHFTTQHTLVLYRIIEHRARYSKAGEHAKAISYFGGVGRPDQGRHLYPITNTNKTFRIHK